MKKTKQMASQHVLSIISSEGSNEKTNKKHHVDKGQGRRKMDDFFVIPAFITVMEDKSVKTKLFSLSKKDISDK